MPDNDPVTQRIADYLLANGFVLCDDPDEIRESVRTGKLDCAAVFPEGFTRRLTAGNLDGCVEFYRAPASYMPDLYKGHVAAAIYREYVPYISAEAFEGTNVSGAEVVAAYEAMFAEGYVFSFDVLLGDKSQEPQDLKTQYLAMGATAILQCAVAFAFCAGTLEHSFRAMIGRLGLRKSLRAVVLPETLFNALWTAVFGGLGLWLAGYPELTVPFGIYSLLMFGTGLLFAAVLGTAHRVYVLLPVLVISSVALCPVYTDLALMIPAVEAVRCLLPAYWFWLIPRMPVLWAAIAVVALIASFGVIVAKCRLIEKYSLSAMK